MGGRQSNSHALNTPKGNFPANPDVPDFILTDVDRPVRMNRIGPPDFASTIRHVR